MPGGTASAWFSKIRAARELLRGAYRQEEFVDFELEMVALGRQRLRRGENLRQLAFIFDNQDPHLRRNVIGVRRSRS